MSACALPLGGEQGEAWGGTDGSHVPVHYHWEGGKELEAWGGTDSSHVPVHYHWDGSKGRPGAD